MFYRILKNSSSTNPRIPPPSILNIRTPAVGGFEANVSHPEKQSRQLSSSYVYSDSQYWATKDPNTHLTRAIATAQDIFWFSPEARQTYLIALEFGPRDFYTAKVAALDVVRRATSI
ncbi:hypothetical protein HO173_003342 [Letharia columbiana]|uniref:Uncharacterized protein n=1 Tax=Letharia columbiana TaxID=112416 RepID=A0A8H6G1U7_9LECA|nr:uncharacterized protein HO173_003342 [Letharia columbiana]KAF6238835.1 hypothetical protein HO173_003342 [Letharia columbiana]